MHAQYSMMIQKIHTWVRIVTLFRAFAPHFQYFPYFICASCSPYNWIPLSNVLITLKGLNILVPAVQSCHPRINPSARTRNVIVLATQKHADVSRGVLLIRVATEVVTVALSALVSRSATSVSDVICEVLLTKSQSTN
jgi:hypothetical protein